MPHRHRIVPDIDTVARSRQLRREGSRAEKICWELLRDRRLGKVKFRRQHPIGPFFADFACISQKLVIEIDGEHHAFQVEADARRTAFLEAAGWRVVRFWASEVVVNPEGIWQMIAAALEPPRPASPPAGGKAGRGGQPASARGAMKRAISPST
jgi:very-short-patch-repair endonuclease